MSQNQAYINAGYSSELPGPQATELLQTNANVKAYLNELLERRKALTLEKSAEIVSKALTKDEKRNILAEIARASLTDFQDATGEPTLTKDTPHNRAAREYYHRTRYDKDGNPVVTKNIKLINPIEAIQEDNKMVGDYAPTKHLVGQVSFRVNMVDKVKRGEE